MHPSPGQILQQHFDLRLVLRLPYAAQESLLWTWELPKSHPGEFSTGIFKGIAAGRLWAALIYWHDTEVFRWLVLPPSPSKPVTLQPFHWARTDRCFLHQNPSREERNSLK